MPGHETVPPDPDDARVGDEKRKRPGSGTPGEDAQRGPAGRHGERDSEQATGQFTEPGDRLPARRLKSGEHPPGKSEGGS